MTWPSGSAPWLAGALAILAGPLLHTPSIAALVGFIGGAAVAWGLGRVSPRAAAPILVAGGVLAVGVLALSPSATVGPLARWFAPSDGLVYWNPVVWLGMAGAVFPAGRVSAGIGLIGGSVYAFAPSGFLGDAVEAAVLSMLVPSMAGALDAARSSAATRPLAWIGAAAAGLALWNFLFMEQYRRNLIPRDDTVSFTAVARTNAALFEQAFGTPATWPASWLFAARHRVSPARYGAVASRSWMLEGHEEEVVDLRQSAQPLFVPLRASKAVDLVLESSGSGTVDIVVNGARVATIPSSAGGGLSRVRVAHSFWRRGVNELRLVPAAGPVTLGRLTLRRVGAIA